MYASPPETTKKDRPYWLLIAFACFVPAILDALRSYLSSTFGEGETNWSDVIFAGTEGVFLGCLTPITYVLAKKFPLLRDRLVRTIVAHFIGALTLCVSWASPGRLSSINVALNLTSRLRPFSKYIRIKSELSQTQTHTRDRTISD